MTALLDIKILVTSERVLFRCNVDSKIDEVHCYTFQLMSCTSWIKIFIQNV